MRLVRYLLYFWVQRDVEDFNQVEWPLMIDARQILSAGEGQFIGVLKKQLEWLESLECLFKNFNTTVQVDKDFLWRIVINYSESNSMSRVFSNAQNMKGKT